MHYKVKFHTQKSRILLKLLPEFQTSLTGHAVQFGQKLSAKFGLNLNKNSVLVNCFQIILLTLIYNKFSFRFE